jgi:hypothetical protein
MPTRRGQDLKLDYDTDSGVTVIVVQRTFEDMGTGLRLTPTPPLLLLRVSVNPGPPIDIGRRKPRYATACIPNAGLIGGESNMKVICPYAPIDLRLKLLLRDIKNYNVVLFKTETVTYTGEGY